MVKQRCVNGELDNSIYSSPMPMIGLYIAGATWVCLLFILTDIILGFRNRKRWLPCRYFSLNSVTLTLLAIAAKLPVDLTTSMPSVVDQLSKLTGTALICTCMSFIMPSLGTNSVSDCFSNMIALSVFVITVIVNICIQIHTGVIILFRVEHIIIMCCMMLLLCMLWFIYSEISPLKEASNDGIKDNLKNDTLQKGNMLYRLKLCYLFSYSSNPQFSLCKRFGYTPSICFINLFSSVVLIKAAFQTLLNSKKLELCHGSNNSTSDYGWSMRIIVISQILIILVGCLGDTCRTLYVTLNMMLRNLIQVDVKDANVVIVGNPILTYPNHDSSIVSFGSILGGFAKSLILLFCTLITFLVVLPFVCLAGFLVFCKDNDDDGGGGESEEFMGLIHKGEFEVDDWSLKTGVKDLKKCIEKTKTRTSSSMNNVVKLLTKTPPSQNQMLKIYYDRMKPGHKMSSLTIVILEKIAAISLPTSLTTETLMSSSLKEVFKIIQFVNRKMGITSSFENKKISTLAKALLESSNFNSYLLPKILKRQLEDGKTMLDQFESELDKAITIIKGIEHVLPADFVRDELCIIANFISDESRHYESVENLCGHIEQLFVDVLNEFLVQLPIAIYKEIVESPPEECEERVRFAIQLLCEVEQLEGLIQWSFPISSITSFITDRDNEDLPA